MSFDIALKALDKIETKLHTFGAGQAELADRVLSLEQRGTAPGPTAGSAKTYGAQLIEELTKGQNLELLNKTKSLRIELKAAGDPVTTSSGRNIVMGGVGVPGGVIGLQNGLPSRNVSATSAIEYSRYTGVQGGAAQQAAEGDAKAALRPDHTVVTQTAITIAGYTKMSRQAMSDSAELRAAVDTVLMREVGKAVDVALVNGATGFTGGFEGLATAYTSLVFTALVDAISEAVATMQVAGFNPNMVALNPADWLAVTTAKGSDGHYLTGGYLGSVSPEIGTLRVVLSPSVDAGKALVMDSAHSELVSVGGFAVEMAYSGDDFTKNLVTLLGEARFIPIFRTVGSARLITPKAA
jgi:Phage capsid family